MIERRAVKNKDGFLDCSQWEVLGVWVHTPGTGLDTYYLPGLDPFEQEGERVINDLVEQGAGGVILGCTEIPLLISQDDCPVPVFDTTALHARAAVNFAFG